MTVQLSTHNSHKPPERPFDATISELHRGRDLILFLAFTLPHLVSEIKVTRAPVQWRYWLNVEHVVPPLPRQFHDTIFIDRVPAEWAPLALAA